MLLPLWEQFLESVVSRRPNEPIIRSLIGQLQPIELSENKIILGCETQGFKFFIQKKIPELEKELLLFFNKKLKIELVVKPKKSKKDAPLLQFQPTINDVFKKAGISGRSSFDNFAVSTTNQVAYAAAQAVAKKLGKAYNPLFLWGGVGVGKTHLAKAVAKHTLEQDPEKKILYCPGDSFTNELIESIREKSTQRFRARFRKLNLLIIDDVQFIAGKNAVQEEFFHTFNAIASAGGQIILTSDRPPSAIKKLEDRLRSRFSGGLIADIQSPDFELRTAILLIKAQEKNIELGIEEAKLICEQVSDSRALEGTLLSLYAKTLGNGEKIEFETVESFFNNKSVRDESSRRITHQAVIDAVCSFYNVRPSHLKSPQRQESVVFPRQVAMFLMRKDLEMRLEEVAFILKRKDHTTVMHGVNKIKSLLVHDDRLRKDLDRIRGLLS